MTPGMGDKKRNKILSSCHIVLELFLTVWWLVESQFLTQCIVGGCSTNPTISSFPYSNTSYNKKILLSIVIRIERHEREHDSVYSGDMEKFCLAGGKMGTEIEDESMTG